MKIRSAGLSGLASLAAIGLAVAAPQPVGADQAEIKFVSKQMGVPVEGKFKKFSGNVDFDAAKPEAAKAQITVDLASIDLGLPEVEEEAQRPLWFSTAKFPTATFTSGAVRSLGGGKYEVAGKLTIKGITRDVSVPITIKTGSPSVVDGAFTIKRLDYKIGEGEWSDTETVANDIQVKFKVTLAGK